MIECELLIHTRSYDFDYAWVVAPDVGDDLEIKELALGFKNQRLADDGAVTMFFRTLRWHALLRAAASSRRDREGRVIYDRACLAWRPEQSVRLCYGDLPRILFDLERVTTEEIAKLAPDSRVARRTARPMTITPNAHAQRDMESDHHDAGVRLQAALSALSPKGRLLAEAAGIAEFCDLCALLEVSSIASLQLNLALGLNRTEARRLGGSWLVAQQSSASEGIAIRVEDFDGRLLDNFDPRVVATTAEPQRREPEGPTVRETPRAVHGEGAPRLGTRTKTLEWYLAEVRSIAPRAAGFLTSTVTPPSGRLQDLSTVSSQITALITTDYGILKSASSTKWLLLVLEIGLLSETSTRDWRTDWCKRLKALERESLDQASGQVEWCRLLSRLCGELAMLLDF